MKFQNAAAHIHVSIIVIGTEKTLFSAALNLHRIEFNSTTFMIFILQMASISYDPLIKFVEKAMKCVVLN